MTRKKKTIEDRLPLIMAFVLPVLVMIGICAGKGVFPFGDKCFLRTDLYHQYCPFYTELSRVLKSGGSLTYTWHVGIGSNFLSIIAYYLCCPTQLLLLIVPESMVIEFMTLMIILKIGLCGYTMAKYLSVKHNTSNLGIVIFGICYALSGYIAAYSWNIMWLDVILLAPIVLLGLEKLVKENSGLLYCITLAICIITNYYISIMLCIFIVLYFICQLICLHDVSLKDILKKLGLFALYSLIAGGISAVIVAPAAYALFTTASAENYFPTDLTNYFSVIDQFARQFVDVQCEEGLDHWPNIYAGIITLLCLPMYYMNRKVDFKEKIVKTVLIFVLLFSFGFNIPNYIWHGLHFPNSLPARQSFLYIFVIITMAYEGFSDIKELSKGKIVGTIWGVIAFVLLCEKIVDDDGIGDHVYLLTLVFVGLYALFIYLYRTGKIKKIAACSLIISFSIIELGINSTVTSVSVTNREQYIGLKNEYNDMLAKLDNDGFYRVEKQPLLTNNDGTFIGYNSASQFSSTTHAGVSDFYRKLGLTGHTNSYSIEGSTPFTSSLLSVRYILTNSELPESQLYKQVDSSGEGYLYENLYTLPLGYMIPEDVNSLWNVTTANPARSQNSLANLLSLDNLDVLKSIPGTTVGSEFSTTINERAHIFVYVENNQVENVTANVGENVYNFDNVNRHFLLDLGYCESGEDILVKTDDEGQAMEATAYAFDEEAFIAIYNSLSKNTLKLDSTKNNLFETSISGEITAENDGALLLSIPYDKGWTIYVDGQETVAGSFSDALTLITLTAGTHTISMSYVPEGLKLGVYISAASLLALVVLIVINIIIKKRKNKAAYEGDSNSDDEVKEISDNSDSKDDSSSETDNETQTQESFGNATAEEIDSYPGEITDIDDLTVDAVLAKEKETKKAPSAQTGRGPQIIGIRKRSLDDILSDMDE